MTHPQGQLIWIQQWEFKMYRLDVAPSQDSSDHQDYEPFLVGNPNLNLHIPLESCEGAISNVS